jgi:hypothetical protein
MMVALLCIVVELLILVPGVWSVWREPEGDDGDAGSPDAS